MNRTASPALRWLRALVVSAVAVGGGTIAHLSAHGLLPGLVALAVLFSLCCCGTAACLGRPASTPRVVLLLMAGQTFVHAGLTMMAGHAGDRARPGQLHPAHPAHPALPVPMPDVPRTGSLFDQLTADRPPAGNGDLVLPSWVGHLVADLTGANALMAGLHLLAAVAVGLWLAVGERALWTLVALAAGAALTALWRLVAFVVPAPSVVPLPDPRADLAGLRPPQWTCSRSVTRRGPPLLLAA